jgi:GntR family transcriptional regulator, galactonate operon transcriptional repressor
MPAPFSPEPARPRLHETVTRRLALHIIKTERDGAIQTFPNEAELCQQLGVSRSVLREAMKVLADKGMIEMRPKIGTRARPRADWRLLDPDVLKWQAETSPDIRFLRDLAEVRLAIQPTAAGFAAVRATPEDLQAIDACLKRREALAKHTAPENLSAADLDFHDAVVAASHNPLLMQLSQAIREPFRASLNLIVGSPVKAALEAKTYRTLLAALHRHDPVAARLAAEKAVGMTMIATEESQLASSTALPPGLGAGPLAP